MVRCYKRFDASFTGEEEEKVVVAVAAYGIGINWYADSGATDHVAADLDKLTTQEKYDGSE